MVICEKYGFVFIHIPKCAGTSIRQQIEKIDDGNIIFGRLRTHPVLGKIDYGHIPLTQLRLHFPDAYAAVERLDTYAVCRHPLQRFVSSVRQTLWSYDRRPMTVIPKAELRDITLSLIDRLAQEIDNPSYKLAFFIRQRDFVFDEGRRLVRDVYPIENVGALIVTLSARIGKPLDAERRSNQNVALRFAGVAPYAYRLNEFLRRKLPQRLHVTLKDAALRVLAKKKTETETSDIAEFPEVHQFVAEYYRDDLDLYRAAQAEKPAIASAARPVGQEPLHGRG